MRCLNGLGPHDLEVWAGTSALSSHPAPQLPLKVGVGMAPDHLPEPLSKTGMKSIEIRTHGLKNRGSPAGMVSLAGWL